MTTSRQEGETLVLEYRLDKSIHGAHSLATAVGGSR